MIDRKKAGSGFKRAILCLDFIILIGGIFTGFDESVEVVELEEVEPEEEVEPVEEVEPGEEEELEEAVEPEETVDPEAEIRGNSIGNINNAGLAARQGDWIYYINVDDSYKIYRIQTDGSGREKVQ